MPATFEDFIELTETRLQQADTSFGGGASVSAATCAALSALTRSLITLGTRYGVTPSGAPVASWQPAFVGLLTAADRRLRRHASPSAAPTAADELIADAAHFLTIAQDLLATHLTTPDPPRSFARTAEGTELLNTSVREHLLRRAAEIVDRLAGLTRTVLTFDNLPRERPNLADAYRSRSRELAAAARDLSDAAAKSPGPARARLPLAPAPVLAAAVTYPRPDEVPAHAAGEIATSLGRMASAAYQAAHRLRTSENSPTHAAGDLRSIARNLAVAHARAADILTRLAPHMPTSSDLSVAEAADRLRAAGAAWSRLRNPLLQTMSLPESGPRSPLTVQANSASIRLGRILYTDPAWTPQVGPGRLRPLNDLLTPDAMDAICIAVSVLPRHAATIADNHARLINDAVLSLYSADRAHRPDREGRRVYPIQPAQRVELTDAYRHAASASKEAAIVLAPLSRGYEALRAAVLTCPAYPARNPDLNRRSRMLQPPRWQPAEGRSISPKQ